MAGLSVGGLVSGLDTNSIIAQLTALEQAKVTREEKKKENAQKALEQFKELQTRLGNLASKASALESLNKFNIYKSTSNYEDYVTVSGKEGATAGQYEIVVSQLATSQKVASDSFSAINKSMSELNVLADKSKATISLSTNAAVQKADPNKKTVDVEISSSDTLKDIVNKINAAEGSGVKASLMTMSNGDNRLILTAVDTGTNGFYLQEGGGTSLLSALGIVDYSEQKATSSGALTVINGGPATLNNTFKDLNTSLNKNTFDAGDKIGIYLPQNNGSGSAGWKTFELFDTNGDPRKPRKIGDVLDEINDTLKDPSVNASFRAELNSSGEIVIVGDLENDQNFNSSKLAEVKIQMGTFGDIVNIKKDMGTLANRNVFKESNIITEGQNAFYTIDGMSVSSQSNNDDKIVNGTIFNLKKVSNDERGPGAVKVSLELDRDAIADAITALVEEFNALMAFIDENAKAIVTEQTDKSTGKKVSVREVGCFTGDSNISSLQNNLKRMMTGIIGELSNPPTMNDEPNPKYGGYYTAYSSASSLGITTQRDGTITVEKDKLLKALETDFEGIRRLFTSNSFSDTQGFSIGNFTKNSTAGTYKILSDGTVMTDWNPETQTGTRVKVSSITANIITLENGISIETPGLGQEATVTFVRGIASQMTNFVEKAKNLVDGYFKTSEKTYQDRIDSIQKRVNDLQSRVDKYNDRITKQFAALEKNIGNLQSQTANMLSALSTVSYSNK